MAGKQEWLESFTELSRSFFFDDPDVSNLEEVHKCIPELNNRLYIYKYCTHILYLRINLITNIKWLIFVKSINDVVVPSEIKQKCGNIWIP